MEQNFGEQINLVINNLSDKLGVAVDKIYPMLIKQAFIDGIVGIGLLSISLILIGLCTYIILKHINDDDLEACYEELSLKGYVLIFVFIIGIISAIVFTINIIDIVDYITALSNPEWYAIKNLIHQIK